MMAPKRMPLAAGTYTIGSGYRSAARPDHRGVDFAAPLGTPIYAPVDMLIIQGADRKPGTVDGFGNWVWGDAQAALGADLVFGHMRHHEIYVRTGERVKAGQLIARVGSEGRSTGPHLHFEVWGPPGRIDGRDLDPLVWLAGAADPASSTTQEGKSVPAYTMNEVDLTGSHSSPSSRHGARPWLFVLHTQEGAGTARSLHDYFKRAQVSYHYTVDNAELVGSVNTDRAAWSVLDANPYTINLCFAGSRAAMSRQEWLDRFGNAIDLAAQAAVRDCLQYGIGTTVHARDYAKIRSRIAGICDHSGITYGLSIGDHTDVGSGFPWDVFVARVKYWAAGGVAPTPAVPAVNAIDAGAVVAAGWIGARVTQGGGAAIDGGKYAHFEHGSIYWHRSTGAFAIPASIFEKYTELRWEQSYLGFPIDRHTVLHDPEFTGAPWGDVQGFAGGAVYRQYGQPGFVVTGMIRAYWNRHGFETGRFGWPISDEQWADETGTVRFQDFEHGRITWSASGTLGTHERPGFDDITTEEV